jgi:hypothetical protein
MGLIGATKRRIVLKPVMNSEQTRLPSFAKRDDSPRWKQVTQVSSTRFTHHLELDRVEDINSQVKGWLHTAWEAAAGRER